MTVLNPKYPRLSSGDTIIYLKTRYSCRNFNCLIYFTIDTMFQKMTGKLYPFHITGGITCGYRHQTKRPSPSTTV